MNSLVSAVTPSRKGRSRFDGRERRPKGSSGQRAARFVALLAAGVLILALLPGVTLTALAQSDLHISGTVYGPDGTTVLPGIGVMANAGNLHVSTQTGLDGSYSLTVLPDISYTLNFQDYNSTYVSGCYDADASGYFTPYQRDCSAVLVKPEGPDVSEINVVMPLGWHIRGTVTGPDGMALPDISVNANNGDFGTGTGTDGSYLLTVLEGSYTVSFSDDSSNHVNGCYSSNSGSGFTSQFNDCTPVEVGPDRSGIDVAMPLGLLISGTVTGPDGMALPGIGVMANAGDFHAGTQTGPNGDYSLMVPSGSYTLNFQDLTATYIGGCYDADAASGHFTSYQNDCTPVEVGPDKSGINVVMPLGQHISGRVTGPGGVALQNISVMANNGEFVTGTDNNGDYLLTVPSGRYTITFYDDGSHYVSGCYGVSGFTVQFNDCMLVEAGPGATGIDVVMPLGWRINGRVTGSGGAGLPGIGVMANAIAGGFGTQTESDGSYSLMVLPGRYPMISFYDNGSVYASGCYSSAGFTAYQNDCTLVEVIAAPVPGIDVVMLPGQHISGTVSGPDGTPLPNINVFERSGSSYGFATQTGSNGRYSLTVPSGEYTVTFYDESLTHVSGCYAVGSSGLVAALYSFTNSPVCTPVDASSGASGIDVTLPLPGEVIRTTGNAAIVYPISADADGTANGISLTFADVTGDGGSTSAVLGSAGPPMSIGFQLAASPTFYDITTTADYSGSITLCVPYDPTAYAGSDPVLLHWNGTNWDDVTSSFDPVSAMICGTVTSLSPFVVGRVAASAAPTPTPTPTAAPTTTPTVAPTPSATLPSTTTDGGSSGGGGGGTPMLLLTLCAAFAVIGVGYVGLQRRGVHQ
jgi:hypothetical protein